MNFDTGLRLFSIISGLIFMRRGRGVKFVNFEVYGDVLEEMSLDVLILRVVIRVLAHFIIITTSSFSIKYCRSKCLICNQ